MISLTVIAKTVVDWKIFLRLTQEYTGSNMAAGLDAKKILDRDLAAFVGCLGSFVTPNSPDPIDTLKRAGSLLRHASISLLISVPCDLLHEIAIEGRLHISESWDDSHYNQVMAILSGNLEQWRDSVINSCAGHISRNLRTFYNKVILEFDIQKLTKIFEEYRRVDNRDGTFLLELKK